MQLYKNTCNTIAVTENILDIHHTFFPTDLGIENYRILELAKHFLKGIANNYHYFMNNLTNYLLISIVSNKIY